MTILFECCLCFSNHRSFCSEFLFHNGSFFTFSFQFSFYPVFGSDAEWGSVQVVYYQHYRRNSKINKLCIRNRWALSNEKLQGLRSGNIERVDNGDDWYCEHWSSYESNNYVYLLCSISAIVIKTRGVRVFLLAPASAPAGFSLCPLPSLSILPFPNSTVNLLTLPAFPLCCHRFHNFPFPASPPRFPFHA